MRRNHGSFWNSGVYSSPGTPEHGEENAGELPKGWSSERVPLPTSGTRRPVSAAALIPYNGVRALPSKWDDAERWITSPISGYGGFKIPVVQPQRRLKSKSGPLGPSGLVYYSPTLPGHEGGNVMVNSPLTTGVLGLSVHCEAEIAAAGSNSLYVGNSITRSTSVPGLSDLLSEASVLSSQDDELDGAKEEGVPVLCRDVATQMSPEGSTHRSSSGGRLSFSNAIPAASISLQANPADKDEVRDVQVDRGTTTRSKRQQRTNSIDDQDLPSAWNVSHQASKLQREESKITAWENLQQAKAEAAIRKLEMKLEKRRSASMEKIASKLRAAEMKAQAIRNSLSGQVTENPSHPRISRRTTLYSKKRCFICHYFLCTKACCA